MRTIFAAALVFAAASPAAAKEIWLTMDQVRPYTLDKPAGQIVVGNPAIADVNVFDKSQVFLFGKTPGATNMFIMDDDGAVIENLVVHVGANTAHMVTLQKGGVRQTYSCVGKCEPTLTVGDDVKKFTETQQQVQTKAQQASKSADDAEN